MNNTQDLQVSDDPALLDLMLADTRQAPALYKPTNYWAILERSLLQELREIGLHDFRRRQNSVLCRFGATDAVPPLVQVKLSQIRWLYNRISIRIPFWPALLEAASDFLSRKLPLHPAYSLDNEQIWRLAFTYAETQGGRMKARPINEIETSLYGNPEAVFEVNGKHYTLQLLYYYLHYVYCGRFVDFNALNLVVELGPGAGKQSEVIKKFHKNITILLFDIPPQSYVCEQYLKAVFPGNVVSYRNTREFTSLNNLQNGKIYIFGNWQFPLLGQIEHDLFINCASFVEMEPDVVQNYLKYVNRSARLVYLNQIFSGKAEARRIGLPGVLRKTVFAHYEQALSNFELINRSDFESPLGPLSGPNNYEATFWKNKTKDWECE